VAPVGGAVGPITLGGGAGACGMTGGGGAGAGSTAGGGGADGADFLPKKSSPTSAFNQSSLPRDRSPDEAGGADVVCASAVGEETGAPSLRSPAAGAGDGAGAGFFLKKLNMRTGRAGEEKAPADAAVSKSRTARSRRVASLYLRAQAL
jgi:hypothetical protein